MKYTSFTLYLLISLPGPIIYMVNGSQQRVLPDLRRFRIKGVAGRFVVNRDVIEGEIRSRKQRDAVCGQGKKHGGRKFDFYGERLLPWLNLIPLGPEVPHQLP